jgi:hypothetical protein
MGFGGNYPEENGTNTNMATTTKPIKIQLSQDDHQLLILALGYATGAAIERETKEFAEQIFALTKKIIKQNEDTHLT